MLYVTTFLEGVIGVGLFAVYLVLYICITGLVYPFIKEMCNKRPV